MTAYAPPLHWSPPPPLTEARLAQRPAPPSAEIRVGDDGRIHGVDGMLDQIAGALMRHAGPMIARDVMPAVREDPALQTRVGQAVGQAVGQEIRPYLLVGAGALALIAAVQFTRWYGQRQGGQGGQGGSARTSRSRSRTRRR